MSKLDELIKELCSKGTEYKNLGDMCQIKTGKLNANAMEEDGKYPFFTCDAKPYRINEYAFDTSAILISGNGSQGGHLNTYEGKFNAYQRTYVLDNFKYVDKTFLYHYMRAYLKPYIMVNCKKGSVPYITLPMLQNFKIPVPPLEVQREIVRILDNFTKLTAELTAELTARKKQYEYYRDVLLNKNILECKKQKLSEIAEVYDGTHQTPDYKTEGVPFISVENIANIYGSQKYISCEDYAKYKIKPKIGDLFMTRIGSIGKCAVFDKEADLAYYVSLALIRPKQDVVTARYLKHYIESIAGTKELARRTLHNAVPIKINKDDIGKILVSYPSLEVQNKICDTLDNFEKICNDLNIGLPAEIEARQKQYEFYRDQLLMFAETGETIFTDRQS